MVLLLNVLWVFGLVEGHLSSFCLERKAHMCCDTNYGLAMTIWPPAGQTDFIMTIKVKPGDILVSTNLANIVLKKNSIFNI